MRTSRSYTWSPAAARRVARTALPWFRAASRTKVSFPPSSPLHALHRAPRANDVCNHRLPARHSYTFVAALSGADEPRACHVQPRVQRAAGAVCPPHPRAPRPRAPPRRPAVRARRVLACWNGLRAIFSRLPETLRRGARPKKSPLSGPSLAGPRTHQRFGWWTTNSTSWTTAWKRRLTTLSAITSAHLAPPRMPPSSPTVLSATPHLLR